jgi:hypothetical protein
MRGFFRGNGERPRDGETGRCVTVADVTDGLSNTICMSERIQGKVGSGLLTDGAIALDLGDSLVRDNPGLCKARFVSGRATGNFANNNNWSGMGRWTDGAPAFTGNTTILGPNGASCAHNGWDGDDGVYEPSSKHTGGVHCLMGDGAVRFVNNSINTGNSTCPPPDSRTGTPCGGAWYGPSPYGIWGALGSIAGSDIVAEL